MRRKGLIPWRRRGLLPGFYSLSIDDDDFFDTFHLSPIKANLQETEKEYIVEADLPGYSKDDVDIRYENDVLTISAKYEEIAKEKGETFIQRECRRTNCSRSFYMPSNVKSDAIKASFSNGVLKVVLPKVEPTRPGGRTIEIE